MITFIFDTFVPVAITLVITFTLGIAFLWAIKGVETLLMKLKGNAACYCFAARTVFNLRENNYKCPCCGKDFSEK